jgi:murein DD-endopeptidase MepM/ murein hydrolase activator NlpD
LIFRRYSFLVTDCTTGTERRFTLPLWPMLTSVVAVLILPVLVGVGARSAVRSDMEELAATTVALRMENDSYRDATGQLASQISALQGAVDDIGAKAAVDPAASRAMDRLPANVRLRAMGGGSGAIAPILGSAIGSADGAFGVLRDLLVGIEDRLALVRSGVERRRVLASATPSIWPVTGWLSSPYGGRRDPFTGENDFHPGLDISSPQGEPVLAPADAVVSTASPNGNYGNLVVLDHGFGIITKYGHLSRFAVTAGQSVKRGDVIGYVGTTGRSTSPHLHYEILMNGQQTNPLRLLAQR